MFSNVLSVVSICFCVFILLVQLDIVVIKTKEDKLDKFRDKTTGLLKSKPNE